jgi:hypothetical protein
MKANDEGVSRQNHTGSQGNNHPVTLHASKDIHKNNLNEWGKPCISAFRILYIPGLWHALAGDARPTPIHANSKQQQG